MTVDRILAEMRKHRADAAEVVVAATEVVASWDRAIAEVERTRGTERTERTERPTAPADGSPRRRAPKGQGVKMLVVDLINNGGGRDWDCHEVLAEFERQGRDLGVVDPLNTVRSALSRTSQDGRIVRTRPGHYGPVASDSVTHKLSTDEAQVFDAVNGSGPSENGSDAPDLAQTPGR